MPCAHFGVCGGCLSQDVPDTDYRAAKRALVAEALYAAGLDGALAEEVVSVVPATRRRAVFKLAKQEGVTRIGFHAARSHSIVDMRECLVLTPTLFRLAQELRVLLSGILVEQESAELHVTEADNGLDLDIAWKRRVTPALTALFARAAPDLIRVTANGETILERNAPFVRLGRAQVKIPPRAFLQASRDGEAALQGRAVAALAGAKSVVDLFAGLGTFAFALAQKARVHAVEQDAPALAALAAAVRATSGLKPMTTEKRDLFKRPLTAAELNRHDAVLLDPPRAGAAAQMREIAASRLERLVYISCDARSFARDARTLVDAGFVPAAVTPIDQFLWSSHIELVGTFSRE
jgi:23S rRNA (uracil1939-C5)-methyltransferase